MTNKVFIGLNNIASSISLLRRGFEDNGVATLTATLHDRNPIKSADVHFQIGEMIPSSTSFTDDRTAQLVRGKSFESIKKYVWEKALRECNVFIFVWNSFEADYSDYRQLREHGKKIVTVFCGDEVRWPHAANEELQSYGLHPMQWDDAYIQYLSKAEISEKLHRLRVAEKYSDLLLGGPPSLQLALRPYDHLWQPIDLNFFVENTEQRERPRVVHAPTDRAFKGTDYVLEAVRRIESEGVEFDLQLIEKMPFEEVVSAYTDGDILVGQLISPNGGSQEREALASGMVVLSSVGIDYPPLQVPDDCPIIPVTPETVYDRLKNIILDRPRRLELARRGRPYVEKYHDAKKVCRDILSRLDRVDGGSDYRPTFFRDKYVPSTPSGRHMCNLYTDFVKDAEWYDANIQPGERHGLQF